MRWKVPIYPKSRIITAGKVIRDGQPNKEEYNQALEVVDNWRASHAFPLQVIYCHMNRKFKDHIVAQRLKRLSSIVAKLQVQRTMSLWEMQDLGGCRIIVSNANQVDEVVETLRDSRMRHVLRRTYDYIEQPKETGYRSQHLVYKYQSDRKQEYNRNMLIEIQVRTWLQHTWATAVEIMGNVLNMSLKSGFGDAPALRFLALTSALFAHMENKPDVPGCPTQIGEIVEQIRALDHQHNYLETLQSIGLATSFSTDLELNKSGYVVLRRMSDNTLNIHLFAPSQIDQANSLLLEFERDKDGSDAVLVRVDSLQRLRRAYPNYYMDISEFVKIVGDALR